MALRAFADGNLFGEVWGEAPPDVLALHGWGRRGADFSSVLDGFSAIAPDLPGFGASPAPKTAMGAKGYAALISPLLAEFDGPVVIVGHSFGGRVGLCLAADAPAEVAGLILTGVPLVRLHPPAKPRAGYRAIRFLNRIGVVSDDRLEAERNRYGSADYRAAKGVMRDVLVTVVNESYEDQLAEVRPPISLVWGSDDAEVPVAVARAALAILERHGRMANLTVVDGAGHDTPRDAVVHLRQAIGEALAR